MALTNKYDSHESDDPVLHVMVIDEHIGEVGRKEGVDSPRGPHEVHFGVEHRSAEGTGEHTRHVNGADAEGPVHHFQRQPNQQLH